jgi:regulator of replication initiation timing
VVGVNKKDLFERFSYLEKQIGDLYHQFGELKNNLVQLIEENHHLTVENHHLRNRLKTESNPSKQGKEEHFDEEKGQYVGEGYDNLARIYEEGFHICNTYFGSPRVEEDCLFCIDFLNKK